jgi:hypothetical protein
MVTISAMISLGLERTAVFTAVTMKNAVLWDVTSCGSCKNRRFGGIYHHLLVTANVVHTSPILVTMMMEAICSPEPSVLTKALRHNDPEDGILFC